MEISLEEAIEIHARALTKRFAQRAPAAARQRAHRLKCSNDLEGHDVWRQVAEVAESLLSEEPEAEELK